MSLTWVILQRDGQQYKYSMFDNTFLFNRDLMDIQIEGWNPDVFLTFDDIVCIKTENYNNQEHRIEQLPQGLLELAIRFSNITELPVFPPSIKKIQLYETGIVLTEEQMGDLRKKHPVATIAISGVPPMKKEVLRQTYYKYVMPSYYLADSDDDYSYCGSDEDEEKDVLNRQHVLDNSQTVHLTSINHSVLESIKIIQKESEKYPPVLTPIQLLFREQKQEDPEIIVLKTEIDKWRTIPSKWAELTFDKLFRMVMTIVGGQPDEETQKNMKQRVLTEMKEAVKKCFMGRMNRLVSSLVGFVDGVSVHLSVKEELQIKSLAIVQAFQEYRINKTEAREQMDTLLKNYEEFEEITEEIKQEYVKAFDDLLNEEN